jgi:hypothetical protein
MSWQAVWLAQFCLNSDDSGRIYFEFCKSSWTWFLCVKLTWLLWIKLTWLLWIKSDSTSSCTWLLCVKLTWLLFIKFSLTFVYQVEIEFCVSIWTWLLCFKLMSIFWVNLNLTWLFMSQVESYADFRNHRYTEQSNHLNKTALNPLVKKNKTNHSMRGCCRSNSHKKGKSRSKNLTIFPHFLWVCLKIFIFFTSPSAFWDIHFIVCFLSHTLFCVSKAFNKVR